MRGILLTFLVALLALPAAAETYKWVDKNGVTHYSDRPAPGAVKIEIEETRPATPPPAAGNAVRSADSSQPTTEPQYKELDLYRPKKDEVFTNVGNTVSVGVRVEPGLQPGHSIWFYMDGKRVDGQTGTSPEFQMKDVWRGTHTVLAVIADQRGKRLISSQPVIFHVRQTSILAPRSPAAPPKPAGK